MLKNDVHINPKEFFSYYIRHRDAPELTKDEKNLIAFASIILGIFSFGLIPLGCYLAFKNRQVTLLDRYKDPNKSTQRIQFFANRLRIDPQNQKTQEIIKNVLKECLDNAKKTEDNQAKEKKYQDLHYNLIYLKGACNHNNKNYDAKELYEIVAGDVDRAVREKIFMQGDLEKERHEILIKFNENIFLEKKENWNEVDVMLAVEGIKEYYKDQERQQKEFDILLDKILALPNENKRAVGILGLCEGYLFDKKIKEIENLLGKISPEKLHLAAQEKVHLFKAKLKAAKK